ncbi:MAG: tetratricopeptide repeat protein [Methylicorpusculum sp.]|uniref:tetratricopeptide repeat protein n=2 Tax=Methylicorpusculum sp. TaxID=2713644 RepID=UPI0027207E82|nr:tetratricopeptide repeat protein [Methylicorpusculum sp.]MDO8844707.1 tetratricopeptide repeat protein [Methylicorpusculum sp.]MDO8938718.1 tetratricopeptide repeat protein [Methylicorpusculum sp.]MDO9239082.1 tetratricopeptide repeat protein [Methylicorpusculum sp.]MDP2178986.1 tetratricopeptide repeat protein [Methylicorpusculum sp.]MDP2201190.1 tetratricopeptide repeat protein [Methylicorpusculum sp.]
MIKKRFLHLLFCGLLLVSISALSSQDKSTEVSQEVFKKLQLVEQSIKSKSFSNAQQTLQALLKDVKKGSYEEAAVLRSLASVYGLQGQYAQGAEALSKALSLKVLPENQRQAALFNLGQLFMGAGQYAKAIDTLKPWLAGNPKLDSETHVMLANAYSQLKQYNEALKHIKQAIQSSNKPDQAWYQLQLALSYELKDYDAAADVLRKLLSIYPDNKDYWQQLASVYHLGKEATKAVTVKHLAYKKGLLNSEKEILDLVNLYLLVGSPYKAGHILAKEINNNRVSNDSKHWELLANTWMQAREYEKALEAFELASKLNGKGDLYLKVGRIYFEQRKWDSAINAFQKALAKGGLNQPGQAYLLLGTSYYESKQHDKARQAFEQARQNANSSDAANKWLNYLKSNQAS